MCNKMKNGCDFCDGFACMHVDKCPYPVDVDCSEDCSNYCDCFSCRFEPDVEYDTCKERPTQTELMEDGHFYIDENGNARPYEN